MATEMEIHALANALHVVPEVPRGYSNEHQGALPQSIESLEYWGNRADNAYKWRRRQADGSWVPIMPGATPGKTDKERGGYPHFITNCEDTCNQFPFPDPVGLGAAILRNDPRWVASFNDRAHGFPYGGYSDAAPAGGGAGGGPAPGGGQTAIVTAQPSNNPFAGFKLSFETLKQNPMAALGLGAVVYVILRRR